MGEILFVLAVLGAVALVARFLRAAFRFLFASAQSTAAAGLAEVSARRGDLSTLAERREVEQTARRARLRTGLLTLLWLLLLVIPLLIGWTREVYVVCSVLWLLPSAPIRRSPRPSGIQ